MFNNRKISAIILAAGTGTRFGSEINKVYEMLNNKPIIEYSVNAFSEHQLIDEIFFVIKLGEEDLFERKLGKYKDRVNVVIGGNSRQESVKNALEKTNSDIVIIHDGARPFITEKMITDCIHTMEEYPGCTVGVKSKDTIKITNDSDIVTDTTIRKNTWIIQTPQCFNEEILKKAHFAELPYGVEMTDDCMLMEYFNHDVKLIEGSYNNIKITLKEDLDIAEFMMKR